MCGLSCMNSVYVMCVCLRGDMWPKLYEQCVRTLCVSVYTGMCEVRV